MSKLAMEIVKLKSDWFFIGMAKICVWHLFIAGVCAI